MGRGSAPQGGAGNYGGSKSAKPRKPRNVSHGFKMKNGTTQQPEEATDDTTPAFTVTRPSRERRAELLRDQRREKAALAELAAKAAALSRRPVNGTSPGGEVLGGQALDSGYALDSEGALYSKPSAESLREARLQHLAKQHSESRTAQASSHMDSKGSSSSSSMMVAASIPVLLPEQERREALEALLKQPIVESWHQSRAITHGAEEESDADISDDELHVLVAFLLDTLVDRLGSVDAAKGVRLLQTVLANVTKDDPKYRRLRASNDKLWAGMLQHPEFCMMLEAAGFQRSTEEQDRCVELEQLEASVQELLASEKIDEAKVEVLLHRMEEVKSTPCGDLESESDNLVGRSTTFLHPAAEILLEDLGVVLEAVAEWTPLSPEEVSLVMSS